MRILINNGRLIDPANNIDEITSIAIEAGRIAAVGEITDNFVAEQTIDAAGQVVCPGLIDLGARLREPGDEQKADIHSESHAAAAAGITTLCQPPDTDPVTDTAAVAELVRKRARNAGFARVLPIGALTQGLKGEQLSELADLKRSGCNAVSNARQPIANPLVLRRAFEYAATHDLVVFLHPEDHWLANNGCAHEGPTATRLGLPGIPEAAETTEVARDLALIQQTGVRAHFCRISTAAAIEMIRRAQHDGLKVTADVAAHQLMLIDEHIGEFNSLYHLLPPLRSSSDRESLRKAVADGTLSAVCSDHQPHEADAKLAPFPATEPGISALETLLPLMLELGSRTGMQLSQIVQRLTAGPAATLGIERGRLEVGMPADITIFNPETRWQLTEERLVSRGHNTPYLGREMVGQINYTLLEGRLVFERHSG
ncbi:dihydroorotase [Solemya pervernicosa gill symbiont]|uniref:Dihydroorotase n=2 Tax=Gammaproteobacteria incertae sedis TaxID=118884 RepID=A0A1T2LA30_9GAMM|nr:dihydroorotase [Candidatus Reidiella endopervernicosa]OOZ41930.1 dihydroorotase [Solemya pervernicosa gill symbiont]QKQ24896.1 dihydroorotase [Candidatus Reidiella endopervernicosa]